MPSNSLSATQRFNSSSARPTDYLDLPHRSRSLVSFNAIERTGTAEVYGILSTLSGQDLSVDLTAQDAYVLALQQMITQGRAQTADRP